MKISLKTKIGLVLLILFFLLLNFSGLAQGFKNSFFFVSVPLQKFLWQGGEKTGGFFQPFFTLKMLKQERDFYKRERERLLVRQVKIDDLQKENEALRAALELDLQKDFQLAPAKAIGLDIEHDILFIDKGERDGLAEGLVVITAEKVLVGRVSEVSSRSAKVVLFSHPEVSFTGRVLQGELTGLIKGGGHFRISFEDLPKEKEVFPGEVVVSSALGGTYPEGLLVGEISRVENLEIAPFQRADLSPFFELKTPTPLFVLLDF